MTTLTVTDTSGRRVVDGEGPIPCEFLILGEAPGSDEEKQGRPFVGASGKLLDRALDAADVRRSEVYITNAYKCRPPGNRTPTSAELNDHRSMLFDEIRKVSPSRVMLLGATALKATLNHGAGVTLLNGQWIETGRRQYYVVFHPAYAIYTHTEEAWIASVRRFFHKTPSNGGP